jgi:cell division protein FtsQ
MNLIPSIPRLRYDRIIWVVFLMVVVLIAFTAVSRKRRSFADELVVNVNALADGSKLISENDVRNAVVRGFGNTLEGTELSMLEVDRVERVLEDDPFVADAEVYVDQHNVLHLDIDQRQPILRILDSNGGNYYLDGNGAQMPPSRNFAARVLVATGNIPSYTADFQRLRRNKLRDLFRLTQTILEDPFLKDFIQQIHLNDRGEFILVPLIGDQKINLGSIRRLEDKLNRLKIFYEEAMPYTGWRKYRVIDLRFTGQIVAKK